MVGAAALYRRPASGGLRRRAAFGPAAEEALFPAGCADHHPSGHSIFDSGWDARSDWRPGLGSRHRHRLLGGLGPDRSNGRRGTASSAACRVGPGHRFWIPRIVFLPEDADVAWIFHATVAALLPADT